MKKNNFRKPIDLLGYMNYIIYRAIENEVIT